jgi:hypothetical protein
MTSTIRTRLVAVAFVLAALVGAPQALAADPVDPAALAALEERSQAMNCLYGSGGSQGDCLPRASVETADATPIVVSLKGLEDRSEALNCVHKTDIPVVDCLAGRTSAPIAATGFDGGDFGIGIAAGMGALALLAGTAFLLRGRTRGRLAGV